MTNWIKNKRIVFFLFVVALLLGLAIQQFLSLRKAHSSFENYYAFRGCVQLLEKNDTSAVCKTSAGQTIKLVKINNQWYLEGDGPGIW